MCRGRRERTASSRDARRPDGRSFTLWQDAELRPLIDSLGLGVIHFSVNESLMNTGEVWLGYVLKTKDEG